MARNGGCQAANYAKPGLIPRADPPFGTAPGRELAGCQGAQIEVLGWRAYLVRG